MFWWFSKKHAHIEVPQCGRVHFTNPARRVEKKVFLWDSAFCILHFAFLHRLWLNGAV
jgi:hypothetical protein